MTALEKLQQWYLLQCNGDWEHQYGIKVDTLDNPGWRIEIDLEHTALESASYSQEMKMSELDWYDIGVKDKKYIATGDTEKLDFLIREFVDNIVPNYSNLDMEYSILLPLHGWKYKLWLMSKAKMNKEGMMRITEIPEPNFNTIYAEELEYLPTEENEIVALKVSDEVGNYVVPTLVDLYDGIHLAQK